MTRKYTEYVQEDYRNRILSPREGMVKEIREAKTIQEGLDILDDIFDAIRLSEGKEQNDRDAGEGL